MLHAIGNRLPVNKGVMNRIVTHEQIANGGLPGPSSRTLAPWAQSAVRRLVSEVAVSWVTSRMPASTRSATTVPMETFHRLLTA